MKLHQLRYLCAIADSGFVISRAAKSLHTSQPGISKQIRLLEDELSVELLKRSKTQILGLTPEGVTVVEHARRIFDNIRAIAAVESRRDHSPHPRLSLINTQLHAGFLLPAVLRRYREQYPNVVLSIVNGHFDSTCSTISDGGANIGVVSKPVDRKWNGAGDLARIPAHQIPRWAIRPLIRLPSERWRFLGSLHNP